jgi:hypothetical protein
LAREPAYSESGDKGFTASLLRIWPARGLPARRWF